jgi:hypothetical protein
MNSFTERRQKKLAEILEDESQSPGDRLTAAVDFLEAELKAAFVRGLQARERKQGARKQ